MKETIITAKRKKIELITMLVCFLLVNLANLYAIITYKTPYAELITSIGYVIIASIVLYVAWSVLRMIYYGVISLFSKKKEN